MKKLLYLSTLLIACTDIDTTQRNFDDDEGENDFLEKTTPSSCNQRWIPTSLFTDRHHNISYESPSRNCSHGAQPGAIQFGNYMRDHFGHLMDLNVDGEGIQIYNCRSVRGGSSPSVHSEGRAIDIFIPITNGTANNAKGDIIANWLIDNAENVGIQYLIWDRTSWKAAGSPSQKCYTGTHPHNNHIHVELTWKASRKQTPFFTTGIQNPSWSSNDMTTTQNNTSQNQINNIDMTHNIQHVNDMSISQQQKDVYINDTYINDAYINNQPIESKNSWIGDPCTNDLDCAFNVNGVIGKCFMRHQPASGIGFCSIPCNGYCPDIAGGATTFCISTNEIGLDLQGICVSKSCAMNDYCQRYSGFVVSNVSRYIGNSNAPNGSADVCLPSNNGSVGTGNGEGNGGICSISDIPLGDNNQSCQGVSAETWRCACSQRLGAVVSQVCRNGVWINFETNPSNCDRCNGPYTIGCNQ